MKILNLYAGIGGNRKLWGDEHEVTAVEYRPEVAAIYRDFFPNDEVVVADAHKYLEDHFQEFDFIWSSPPCPSHSKVRFITTSDKKEGGHKPLFPSMKLYEEILFLQHYFKGKWVVENVIAFYQPLITPYQIGSHWFWSNFYIPPFATSNRAHDANISTLMKRKGFDLTKYEGVNKRLVLRNCVEPEVALHILNCSLEEDQLPLLV